MATHSEKHASNQWQIIRMIIISGKHGMEIKPKLAEGAVAWL